MQYRLWGIGLLCGLLFGSAAWGQQSDRSYAKEVLHETERALQVYGDSMMFGSTQGVRVFALTRFIPLLRSVFQYPEAFDYPFDSLKFVSKLSDPQHRFRILTWGLRFKDGSIRHYGVLLRKHGKDSISVTPLRDAAEWFFTGRKQFNTSASPERWLGAVYYDLQCMSSSSSHGAYCILLGWNGTSPRQRRKLIEPFQIRGDSVVFGLPVLSAEHGMRLREVLEYHPTATLTLRFDEKAGRPAIVFDHLVMQRIPQAGEGMVPDGTYDYYLLQPGGIWQKGSLFFGKGPSPSRSKP